jgi:hypothetical protein
MNAIIRACVARQREYRRGGGQIVVAVPRIQIL